MLKAGLKSVVTLCLISGANLAYAEAPLRVDMARAETLKDGTKVLWVFDNPKMKVDLAKYKDGGRRVWASQAALSRKCFDVAPDGTKVTYDELSKTIS